MPEEKTKNPATEPDELSDHDLENVAGGVEPPPTTESCPTKGTGGCRC